MEYDRQHFARARDGTRLFYGIRGPTDGPREGAVDFVLTDGVACDGFAWTYLQPFLARRHRVLHWHYRGHGRSGLPADPAQLDIPAHARDLLSVMDAAEVESAILAGHSMGTQTALEVLRLAPERIRGLVLMCGSYGKITATFRGSDLLKQALPTIIETVEKNQGLVRALWGRIPSKIAFQLARLSKEVDALAMREEDFRMYIDHVAAMEPKLMLTTLRLAGEHSAEDLLPRIAVPTLVVAAERDTFTPKALAEHMAESIPGAEILVLKGASHAGLIEQPEAVEARISLWLTTHFGEAPHPVDPQVGSSAARS